MTTSKISLVIFLLFVLFPALGSAQTNVDYSRIWERFSGADPDSKAKIDHYPYSYFLSETVLFVGRSRGFLGNEKPDYYRRSHIPIPGSLLPSRFEGSRVFFHELTDVHKDFFKEYQAGLEGMTSQRGLKTFSKNEQLAFWLNLYNVTVLNRLIADYPVAALRGYRSGKAGQDDFWNQRTIYVEDIPLSLIDIENILFHNFESPLVAFGLWQGAIGGPRLRNEAFTGDKVWAQLENNAVEFVNSNRGLRPPRGDKLKVSEFYEWTGQAFGPGPDAVLGFVKRYADPNFVDGIDGVSEISFSVYDWQIADVLGGTLHVGELNQLGGVLTGKSQGPATKATGGGIGGLMDVFKMFESVQKQGGLGQLPPGFYKLLLGMRQNSHRPVPVITTEECAPGEECGADPNK